jgi:uncharacterized repeat protein (TIGR02543 family)
VIVKYEFVGWKDTNGNSYDKTLNLITEKDSEIELYAQWKAVRTVLPAPTRTGYSFAGWYEDMSLAENTKVGNAASAYIPTDDIMLYGNWTANVTLNANGGTTPTNLVTLTVDGKYQNLPTSLPNIDSAHVFGGWYYNGVKVENGSAAKSLAPHTLTAVWVKTYYSTGYYSRDTIFVDNDFEGDECITDWFNPGFDVSTLKANGYTKIKVSIAVHGERNTALAPNNQPYIDIYNANNEKIATIHLDKYGANFSIQNREFYLDLNVLIGDGRLKFRYDTTKDSWELGTTEVTMVAEK